MDLSRPDVPADVKAIMQTTDTVGATTVVAILLFQ